MGESSSRSIWVCDLYEAKAAEILLYGRALGLSHSEGEDVLQETFVALLALDEPPAQPHHYAIRAFRNRALNFRRSLWRRLAREVEAHRWFEKSAEISTSEERAMRCLVRLPVEQREVIVLKIWHGETFESIGELLAISPNTAAGRYRYGLQKLRECLKGTDYEQLAEFGRDPAPLETPGAIAADFRAAL